jgi:hypothetical protein
LEQDSKTCPAIRAECSFFTLFDEDSDDDYCPVPGPDLEDLFAFDTATLHRLSHRASGTRKKGTASGRKRKSVGVDLKHTVCDLLGRKSTHLRPPEAHQESAMSSSRLFPTTQDTGPSGCYLLPEGRSDEGGTPGAASAVAGKSDQKERRDPKDVKREKTRGVQKKLKALRNHWRK